MKENLDPAISDKQRASIEADGASLDAQARAIAIEKAKAAKALTPPTPTRPGRAWRRAAWAAAAILAAGAAICALNIPHPHLWGRWHPMCLDGTTSITLLMEHRYCIICGASDRKMVHDK